MLLISKALRWQKALSLIANIDVFPTGRRNAIAWLQEQGVKELRIHGKVKQLAAAQQDDSGWICTDYLSIAVAQFAIYNEVRPQ